MEAERTDKAGGKHGCYGGQRRTATEKNTVSDEHMVRAACSDHAGQEPPPQGRQPGGRACGLFTHCSVDLQSQCFIVLGWPETHFLANPIFVHFIKVKSV